ncbi:MAG TPA: hypothetical protein VLM79_08030 [Kofleriaceae bacterium]|nr:hypothetical protein [Kofleriaceae bacterium]
MTRVLSSACVVLLLVVWGGNAWAGGKPPIAILGLEVYDNGSGIDPETTKAAKDVTAALRERARVPSGPYALVLGGEKELIDEKLLNNCDSEAPTCMANIGSELGAELLMYGKIEKVPQNGQNNYKVSIKLLNVLRKQLASSTVENIPAADASGVKVSTHAKSWYSKLATVSVGGGSVAIKANIDRGMVLVDDDPKGNLTSGMFSYGGLTEGRHTLAIEAKDYQRYEISITIRNGETLQHSATLVEMPKRQPVRATEPPISIEGTIAAKPRSNGWKPVFYGAVVLDAGAIGYTIYQWRKAVSAAPSDTTDANCGDAMQSNALKNACDHNQKNKIGFVVSSVLGAAVVGSFFMAFIRHSDGGESPSTKASRRKRRELAITPIVTPDGGGATLRVDW